MVSVMGSREERPARREKWEGKQEEKLRKKWKRKRN